MKERLKVLLEDRYKDVWVNTFHSACSKILRRYIDRIGYQNNFVILDYSDQQVLVKDCIKELSLNESNFQPRAVLAEISKAKDDFIEPESF